MMRLYRCQWWGQWFLFPLFYLHDDTSAYLQMSEEARRRSGGARRSCPFSTTEARLRSQLLLSNEHEKVSLSHIDVFSITGVSTSLSTAACWSGIVYFTPVDFYFFIFLFSYCLMLMFLVRAGVCRLLLLIAQNQNNWSNWYFICKTSNCKNS